MIDLLINIVLLLVILVVLVVIHEFGHFIVARRAKVRVHEFGIGFPPRAAVLGNDGETTYTLNWLPLGGFVRLEGEEGESDDPRSFVRQRLRTRLTILLAGVAMNFVLAFLIFAFIAAVADPVADIRVAAVQPNSPAEAGGLRGGNIIGTETDPDGNEVPIYDETGDVIVAIDGQRFPRFDRIDVLAPSLSYLREHAGQEVTLTLRANDGTLRDVRVQLRQTTPQQGALGIIVHPSLVSDEIRHDPLTAVSKGFDRTVGASTLVLRAVGELVTNLTSPPVAGPVGIVGIVGGLRAELPPIFMLWFIGLLSANLAVINVLPFPPLDGGRVAVSLIQAATSNRISEAAERLVYLTGFILLMLLLAWVTLFDTGILQRTGL
ncbi:MAG TPA: M50 family metallopeptidase [Candidatus Limnocylindrales bacterium]|jgi:regulator of sigma E protease|nr:M50 family metallopeptidase [Candidatus Limnocylindrales bacterium]